MLLDRIAQSPESYVFAIEARTEFDGDIVTHISSTLAKAREYCLDYDFEDFACETRLHIIPHLIDAPDSVHDSGVISVAVYGATAGGDKVVDLIDTKDE